MTWTELIFELLYEIFEAVILLIESVAFVIVLAGVATASAVAIIVASAWAIRAVLWAWGRERGGGHEIEEGDRG